MSDTTTPEALSAADREAVQATPDVQGTAPEAAQLTFADFDVNPEIVAALADAGIVHPFPIQAMTLPVALGRHDIIGQAKTGTGKTLGFGIPILEHIDVDSDDPRPQALAVAPTRELAGQVAADLERAGKRLGIKVLTVYGGRAYEPQIEALKKGVHVVVGTPGRLIDLAQQKHLDLSATKTVVLDEADEMLDLGFLPDVEKIMAMTSPARHTMLFSATMPGAIVALARRYMTQPTHIRAMSEDGEADSHTVKATEQFVYRAHAMDKVEMVSRILQAEGRGLTIIFSRTKRTAAKVADELVDRGFAAASLHGDLGQGAREQALRAFRNGKVDVLVATDVAARGIDVTNVTHVINYQCPDDEKTYVHRIGRTGRAGNTGIAVTFVDWDDETKWAVINRQLDLGIPSATETYSSSPHLFTDLDIPEGTKGRLPRTQRTREGLDAEQIEDLGETGKSSGRRQSSRGGSGGGRDGGRGGRDGGRGGRDGGRGSRDGGGRDAERSGNRDSERSSDQPSEAKGDGEGRPRRRRNRRRTHGGQSDQVQDAG
ncbi:DEAD/DEAH box helicase [Janibacter limosus]|uniref:RNA helicase n=1 Tax=Janibacter limosus TaxID=53458 RepID=A0A4P6MV32_9MICO|nr:DEAD/DEAH box helicase [Janibacter limosus]QBF46762.1 DEAD/DEAH box helicase [Janibacter limosus]